MRYLSAEEIIAIHERVLLETGGLGGFRDIGLLFSIAEKPKTIIAGQEVYNDKFVKAAVLLESLINYHVFADGNKRTAILTALVFLATNDTILSLDEVKTFDFIISITKKEKTIKQIASWLRKKS